MNRYEKQKKAIQSAMAEHVHGYQGILAKAKDEDDRDFTDDERVEIEDHLKAIENLKVDLEAAEKDIKTAQRVEDIGREIGPALGHVSVGTEPEDRLFEQLNKQVWPAGAEDDGRGVRHRLTGTRRGSRRGAAVAAASRAGRPAACRSTPRAPSSRAPAPPAPVPAVVCSRSRRPSRASSRRCFSASRSLTC